MSVQNLLFTQDVGGESDLFATDGSSSHLLADLSGAGPYKYDPVYGGLGATVVGSTAYLVLSAPSGTTNAIYSYNGSSLTQITSSTSTIYDSIDTSNPANTQPLAAFNGNLVFSQSSTPNTPGHETLAIYNTTTHAISQPTTPNGGYDPHSFTVLNNTLYFEATDSTTESTAIYSYNGSSVTEIYNLHPSTTGDFGAGPETIPTKGTVAGGLVAFNGNLYFGSAGNALYEVTSTGSLSNQASDMTSTSNSEYGFTSSAAEDFEVYNGKLYFFTNQGGNNELAGIYSLNSSNQVSVVSTYYGDQFTPVLNGSNLYYVGAANTGGYTMGAVHLYQIDSSGAVSVANTAAVSGSDFTVMNGVAYYLDNNAASGLGVFNGSTPSNLATGGSQADPVLVVPFTASSVTGAPPPPPAAEITSVNVPASGVYHTGQTLTFTANFSANVTVTGTPEIAITLPTGGVVDATYAGGTGTSALSFSYTIVSGEQAANGISVGSAITLNGGTIKDASGDDATLTLNGVGSTANVDVQAIPPTVSSIILDATSPNHGASEAFTVTFSEAMNPSTVLANAFTFAATGSANASGISVSEVNSTTYTVTLTGVSGDGTLRLDLKGGSGTADAYGNIGSAGYSSGPSYTVDHTAPTILGVNASLASGGAVHAGQSLSFTAHTSEAVTVTGTPELLLSNGGVATYVSGSGSSLSFAYQAASGQYTGDLHVTGLALNGGSITDTAGNALSGGSTLDSGLSVDAGAPTILGSATSTHPAEGGAAIHILSGAPTITDADGSGVFSSAAVQIGSAHGGDALSITGVDNGAVTIDGATFTVSGDGTSSLTITGNGTATQYADVLQAVTYQDGSTDDAIGAHPTRTVDFTVTNSASDGGLISDPFHASLTLDRAPSAVTDHDAAANAVAEGAAVGSTVGVTAVATDPDGDAVTYTLSGDTSAGGFTVDANTGVVSVADPSKIDFASGGADHTYSVSVTASDGTLSSTQSFTVQVNDVAPSITGTLASQATSDEATVAPFSAVTIHETGSATQLETVTVTLSDPANGGFTNASLTASGFTADPTTAGQYDFTGTATQATTAIDQLVFSPTANQTAPGGTVTTTFAIHVGDGTLSADDSATSVVATSLNDPPSIAGATGGQAVLDNATATPFATVVVADADIPAQTQTVTVALDHPAYGSLSNLDGGTYDPTSGVYSFTGTAAEATAAVQGLVFTPVANQITPGASETEGFTITANDGVASTVSDTTTSLTITSVNDPPTIAGATANQALFSDESSSPFVHLVIADADVGQTETVAISLSVSSHGAFSNLAGGTYDPVAGLYTVSGSAADVTTAVEHLVFTPSGVGTTTFSVSVSDGVAPPVSDSTTSVVVSSPPPPPPSGGTGSGPSVGTESADSLVATAGGDTVYAHGGDDQITGGSGHDMLYGNAGNDHIALTVNTDSSTVFGGQGDDNIDASQSTHDNFLSGDLGNDSITLGSGADTAYGGDGMDTIIAGAGHDQIYGNGGDDHIVLEASSGASTVFAGQGDDMIDASHSTQNNFISADLGDDYVTLGSGADTAYAGDGADTVVAGSGHDQLYGNAGSDYINIGATNQGSTVFGGQGGDVIDASTSTHANYISGDAGTDIILTGQGADTIHGGEGSDTITAASGATAQIHVGLTDSSALAGQGQNELDHILGFGSSDKLVFDGDAAATTANTVFHGGDTAITDFAAAYAYAYGSGSTAGVITGSTEYAVVSDSAGHVYVFAADHAAVELDGLSGGVNGVSVGQIVAA